MKKCKKGYYYCYTDKVCKPIPQGLKMTARFSGGGKNQKKLVLVNLQTVTEMVMVMAMVLGMVAMGVGVAMVDPE